jgi:uncharacterized membrane protein YagU involved in acid resistance
MTAIESAAQPARAVPSRSIATILWIGLIAGTLDISENLIFNAFRGITPPMVFRFIASGLVGPQAALRLGIAAVILGILLHYFIATTWTAVFYVASRRFSILTRRAVISGLLYGCFVYAFMNAIVLPLSRVPKTAKITVASRISGVLAVLLCIGLTISLLVRRNMARGVK